MHAGLAQLVRHMTQLEPDSRHDMHAYLHDWSGVFPDFFEPLHALLSPLMVWPKDHSVLLIKAAFSPFFSSVQHAHTAARDAAVTDDRGRTEKPKTGDLSASGADAVTPCPDGGEDADALESVPEGSAGPSGAKEADDGAATSAGAGRDAALTSAGAADALGGAGTGAAVRRGGDGAGSRMHDAGVSAGAVSDGAAVPAETRQSGGKRTGGADEGSDGHAEEVRVDGGAGVRGGEGPQGQDGLAVGGSGSAFPVAAALGRMHVGSGPGPHEEGLLTGVSKRAAEVARAAAVFADTAAKPQWLRPALTLLACVLCVGLRGAATMEARWECVQMLVEVRLCMCLRSS